MGTPTAFHQIVIKLGDNVCGHNILFRFDTQSISCRTCRVVSLNYPKLTKLALSTVELKCFYPLSTKLGDDIFWHVMYIVHVQVQLPVKSL